MIAFFAHAVMFHLFMLAAPLAASMNVDASNNYWGGLDPNTHSTTYWPSFNYTLHTQPPANFFSSPQSYSGHLDCGIYLNGTDSDKVWKKTGMTPQSSLSDSCSTAMGWAEIWIPEQKWQLVFDTMHWYLQHCYDHANYDNAWQDFGAGSGQVTLRMPQDSLLQLRAWLLSERHLNPADGWYCDCIEALIVTWPGDFRVELAILKFLIDNSRCSGNPRYGKAYSSVRGDQISVWADTAKDPNHSTFDSTLPSLHELGLDSLLQDAAVGTHYEAMGPQIIGSARVTANPFAEQTSVSLTVNREAYIRIEIFDLLGRKLQGAGSEGAFEPGTRDVPLNMNDEPPGAYYVRISTANNEVLMMKLAKE